MGKMVRILLVVGLAPFLSSIVEGFRPSAESILGFLLPAKSGRLSFGGNSTRSHNRLPGAGYASSPFVLSAVSDAAGVQMVTQIGREEPEKQFVPNWRGAESISRLTESIEKAVFDIEQIKTILPHRYPFLLVDKVLEFEPGKRAVGVKQMSANEDQFNGHFPQRAVTPGVLQVEALAQLCGIVALQHPVSEGKGQFFFAGVDGVKWKKPVVPGDTLVMEVELDLWKAKFGIAKFHGTGYVDGKVAIEVKEMTFALIK